jgi:fructose transport system substrate-binding protein
VLIVSVDGGCPGVGNVKDGVIGATSQQYPLDMASKGIEAIAAFAKDGTKPAPTEGKAFVDTGVRWSPTSRSRASNRSTRQGHRTLLGLSPC